MTMEFLHIDYPVYDSVTSQPLFICGWSLANYNVTYCERSEMSLDFTCDI